MLMLEFPAWIRDVLRLVVMVLLIACVVKSENRRLPNTYEFTQ